MDVLLEVPMHGKMEIAKRMRLTLLPIKCPTGTCIVLITKSITKYYNSSPSYW